MCRLRRVFTSSDTTVGVPVRYVQRRLLERFDADISHIEVSRVVSAAFPNARRRMCSATKCYRYYGITPVATNSASLLSTPSVSNLGDERLGATEMSSLLSTVPVVARLSMPPVQSQLPVSVADDTRSEVN